MYQLPVKKICVTVIACLFFSGIICIQAQSVSTSFTVGDALPDAPALAPRGEYKVGVRTLNLLHKNQVDVLNAKAGIAPLYDRPLTVEVWYPAVLPAGKKEEVAYQDFLGQRNDSTRPLIPFDVKGRALRDATPLQQPAPFPLIIVSHGYLGSRYIMTYLTENLASKGYVVVAIDHTESTYKDVGGFASTLLNRAKDDLFVLDEIARFSKPNSKNFLSGIVDADNTAIIGYSMGGYGALNAAGAGYSNKLDSFFRQITAGNTSIESRVMGNAEFIASADKRIKAVVAFAPWGMQRGIWEAKGLAGLKVPTFLVAGSQDDVSGYEDGIKAIYTGLVNANHYLLTYENARHNVAPNPPPPESLQTGVNFNEYYHYAEPAWNEHRINNINQHFVTAFLGVWLQHKDYGQYLSLPEKSNQGNWTGFKPRTSVGLALNHAAPAQ